MWKEGLVDRNINSYYYIKIQKISEQTNCTCMYDFNAMLIVWVSISNLRTKPYLKVILKSRVTKRERLK